MGALEDFFSSLIAARPGDLSREQDGRQKDAALVGPISGSKGIRSVTGHTVTTPPMQERVPYHHPMEFVTIHHLPIELLVRVFRDATGIDSFPAPTPTAYYDRLHTLSQVCRVWYDVAQSPELWCIVCAGDPHWATALARSQAGPLTVDADLTPPVNPSFVMSLIENAYRWRSATFVGGEDVDLSMMLKGRAPILEELSISLDRAVGYQPKVDLFCGYTPKLQRLNLRNVALCDWRSASLTGLRALSLEDIAEPGPSLIQVLEALRRCPQMEDLKLSCIEYVQEARCGPAGGAVQLDRLRAISIKQETPEVVIRLLTSIRCPSALDLKINIWRMTASLADAVVFFATPSFLEALRASNRIEVRYSPVNHIKISIEGPGLTGTAYDLRLKVGRGASFDWLPRFLRQSQFKAGTSLPITMVFFSRTPETELLHALHEIPRIDRLVLIVLRDANACVRRLSKGLTLPGDVCEYLFPELTSIEFKTTVCSEIELVLEMVRSRSSVERLRSAKPLQSLRLAERTVMDLTTWAEIKGILGEGAVWPEELDVIND
ncbi:hypothetical protein FRB98_000532 [Tulasnella sp. 332]|nr:hypothetical protein FRB98_000532 [Tulasnella sp. 332]